MVDNHRLTADEAARIDAEIAAEIDAATALAQSGTLEAVEDLERFVLMDSVVQDAAAGEAR
jgi:hypothetical protein